jgi:cytochrome c oxidase subunit 2
MEKEEQRWFGFLILIALVFNVVTLSPLVPWQKWLLWSRPLPDQRIHIEMEDYQIKLPSQVVEVKVDEYVEFVATSMDVTYGFGVFRSDGSLVFQLQVVPGHENSLIWKFETPGTYDVRSTEYSGPKHSAMFLPGAIRVIPSKGG